VWEAAMAGSHYRLDNLIAIIDHNKLQISGDVDSVMRISSLKERWASFGWEVHETDGNDMVSLTGLFDRLPGHDARPQLVVAHTTKGKGVSFIENNPSWHHRVPTKEEYERAQRELETQLREVG
jgi:transketolase